jgi:hypothetical protein
VDIQNKLEKNVKMIFSTNYAFAALLNDGNVVPWGYRTHGGEIPLEMHNKLKKKKILTIIPYRQFFNAICTDGEEFKWGQIVE